jgi:alginate O-acetyltransferase complex protein AlgI
MGFNSLWYIMLLPLTAGLFYLLPHRYRWILLLVASYLFYGFYEPKFLILIGSITLISYLFGLWVYRNKSKVILGLGVSMVISFLLFFKYSIWLADGINDFLRWLVPYRINSEWLLDNVILPIGISFYTFQAISYLVDVYKQRIQVERHLGYVALYLAFFPQLVAGPIEKPGFLLPQLKKKASLFWQNFSEGSKLILLGFFKKIVIADNLYIYVERVFDNISSDEVTGMHVILGLFAFCYYLFNDFSGYCDIALGSAKYFDVQLSQNFFKPFSSLNFREFWVRWHATLSQWVKAYVFVPLGGIVRGNRPKTLFNVLIVFVVLGLWHGASNNFLYFGLLAAFYVILDHATKDLRMPFYKRIGFTKDKLIPRFIFKFTVFLGFVSLGIFFINPTLVQSLETIEKLIHIDKDFQMEWNMITVLFGVFHYNGGNSLFFRTKLSSFCGNKKCLDSHSIVRSYCGVDYFLFGWELG